MKKLFLIAFLSLLAYTAVAQTDDDGYYGDDYPIDNEAYTVSSVPNTRVMYGDDIHVSNPNGIISNIIEDEINHMLDTVRKKADIFVVALPSIGYDEIEDFATSLFNTWGIGEADIDNGILVLLVLDQRAVRIEVGYGMESTFPDALCMSIIQHSMIPHFKEGKYSIGLYEGVDDMVRILYGEDTYSKKLFEEEERRRIEEEEEFNRIMMILGIIVLALCFAFFVYKMVKVIKAGWGKDAKTNDGAYAAFSNLEKESGCLIGCAIFFPLLWIPVILSFAARKRARTMTRTCNKCGSNMRRLGEDEEDVYLSEGQQMEEKLKVRDYDVWYCDKCGHILSYYYKGANSSSYQKCNICGLQLMKMTKHEVVQRPTYTSTGLNLDTYTCQHCGYSTTKRIVVPRREKSSSSSGSGRSGGSFGGGHSGGGGATGRW